MTATLRTITYRGIATAAAVIAATGGARAQEPAETAIEAIIVTAQRRAQPIQDVPLSITAIGATQIERAGISEFDDYAAQVPNLAFSASNSSSTDGALAIAIRGVFGAGTTGFYIDDSPLVQTLNPRVIDLERIEVLRGPQGTLYGARSMGGTVRLITTQPDVSGHSGRIRAVGSSTTDGGGNYGFDGALNLALVEGAFAMRIVGYGEHDDGFIDRAPRADAPVPFPVRKDINAEDVWGLQLAALWTSMDGRLRIVPRVMHEDLQRDGRTQADFAAGNRTNLRQFDLPEPSENEWTLATLTATYDAGAGSVLAATSWLDRSYHDSEDFSEWTEAVFGMQAPSYTYAETDQEIFSQELRFVSTWDSPVDLTAGLFYQRSRSHWVFPVGSTTIDGLSTDGFHLDNPTTVKERAVFAEATWHATDRFRIILGGRYFENDVDFYLQQGGDFVGPDEAFSGTQSESGFTPKAGLQYDIDGERMLYATYSEGFRIGGVNFYSPLLCSDELEELGLAGVTKYQSDSLDALELGLKSRWLDGRLTVNGAAFWIDWQDLQQRQGLSCGFTLTLNAGTARLKGAELELDYALASGTLFHVGLGYIDSEITDNGGLATVIEGSEVQNVPNLTWNAALEHNFSIARHDAYLRFDYGHTDDSLSGNNSTTTPLARPAYEIANLRFGVRFGDDQLTLFAMNLFDEAANYADIPPLGVQTPGRPRIVVNQPRTLGLEWRRQF